MRRDALFGLVEDRLLDTTFVRVGNDACTYDNGPFGIPTLRRRHAQVGGNPVEFRFRGKSGVRQQVALDDARVARIVRRRQATRF